MFENFIKNAVKQFKNIVPVVKASVTNTVKTQTAVNTTN